jgi:excisionase family DNA binding protein
MSDTNTPVRPPAASATGRNDTEAVTMPTLLTSSQVSQYLRVPASTLANWRYQGRGPAFVRLGGHVRYRASDVTEWIDRQLANNAS